MEEQNFKNHTRLVAGFHYVTFALIMLAFVGGCINLYHEAQEGEGMLEPLVLILLSVSVLMAAFYARTFALKAQDRAIRAEENFRHYLLTGKPLDANLKMGQVIALRFAADDEYAALAQKAAAEGLGSKAIKQEIKNWKADHNRV